MEIEGMASLRSRLRGVVGTDGSLPWRKVWSPSLPPPLANHGEGRISAPAHHPADQFSRRCGSAGLLAGWETDRLPLERQGAKKARRLRPDDWRRAAAATYEFRDQNSLLCELVSRRTTYFLCPL